MYYTYIFRLLLCIDTLTEFQTGYYDFPSKGNVLQSRFMRHDDAYLLHNIP